MSWLGKKVKHIKKVARSPRRALRSLHHAAIAGPYGMYGDIPRKLERRIVTPNVRKLKNHIGSNSSASVASSSYNAGNGYVYSGKSLSEMM